MNKLTLRMLLGTLLLVAGCVAAADTALLKPVGGVGAGEVHDGLRVTLKPVKDEFGPGESVLMQCTVANVGDTEKKLTVVKNRLSGQYDFTLELRRAGKALAFTPRVEKDNPARVERELAPGAKLDFWIDLRAMIADAKDKDTLGELGGYEAAVVFTPTGAHSGWVPFTVAEAGRPTPKPKDPAEAEKIRSLIQQLGDDDFQKRENAEAELTGYGERAIGLLKEGMEKGNDAEVKLRCRRVIERIEKAVKQRFMASRLCAECSGKSFVATEGVCAGCRGGTPSSAWKFCRDCGMKLGICPACGKALDEIQPPAPIERPLPVRRPRPIRVPEQPVERPVAPPPPQPQPVVPEDDF